MSSWAFGPSDLRAGLPTAAISTTSVHVLCGSTDRGGKRCWNRKRFRPCSGLKELGCGMRRIARQLGISRNTVRGYIEGGLLAADSLDRYLARRPWSAYFELV